MKNGGIHLNLMLYPSELFGLSSSLTFLNID